jgi:hypothetical protein
VWAGVLLADFVVDAARAEILRCVLTGCPQDDKLSWWSRLEAAAGGGGFGFDDGAFAGGAGLALVADEKMFHDRADTGVFEAG